MTEYKFPTTEHYDSLGSDVKEAKEKRRKQLEAVFKRRRENYKRFLEKMRLQAERKTDITLQSS
jgi:vacuolar-type H+-ATPase subunit H